MNNGKAVLTDVKRPSPREMEVLRLLVCGKRNSEVGAEFKISEKTVEAHRANLCRKFGVRGLVALVASAVSRGYVPMPTITDDGVIEAGGGRAPRDIALKEAARAVCVHCMDGCHVKQFGRHWRHDAALPCSASPIWSLVGSQKTARRAGASR